MPGLRQALRTVRRQSGSAAVVIGTLAVSIAATTIIASLIEFLLHAIPVADPARLAMVSSTDPRPSQAQSGMSGGVALSGTSVPDLLDWSARARTIDEFIAFRYDSATLRENGVPERVRVVRTTANLPESFGFRPTSNRSGSGKTSSSRFAEQYQIDTLSPSRMRSPRSSTSRIAVRRKCNTGGW